ncbi:MAG: hypothetical protein JWM02_3163 [Frankiales bacterium]|nr:hypothetical protein [Frankiales bacterium]
MEVLAARLSWRRLSWSVEVLSILVGYVAYAVIRVLAPHRVVVSYEHAYQIVGFEQAFGLFHELGFNGFLSEHPDLEIASAYYYATLHFIVTPLLLVWVWKRRTWLYAPLRSALVIATGGALVVYATWPLAPPRFVLPGAVDTVLDHPVLWASGHGVESFINDLAAMPSLHVGWALWCAVAVVATSHSAWRHLIWLYPLATTVVVVATANHYLLDAFGGAAVVGVPLYLCGLRLSPSRVLASGAVSRSAPGALPGTAGDSGMIGAMRT